jgi:hypothetical protein
MCAPSFAAMETNLVGAREAPKIDVNVRRFLNRLEGRTRKARAGRQSRISFKPADDKEMIV